MKTSILALLAIPLALALPQEVEKTPLQAEADARQHLEETGVLDISNSTPFTKRQILSRTTANELVRGGCGEVIFIFARGSTESGNLGQTVGPAVAEDLRDMFDTTVQGVDYAAGLGTNVLPGGGDPLGIREMERLWKLAATQCPNSAIVGGGYSQGAALTHRSIENIDAATRSRITAVLLFGDTQRQQTRGIVEGIAAQDTKIICNVGDLVCQGTLIIAPPHLAYVGRADEGSEFLAQRIQAKTGITPNRRR